MNRDASLLLRVVAKCIDFILVLAAAEALPKSGWLAGAGYLLISDGLFNGMSIGKKLIGLQVVTIEGAPCSIKDSIVRNTTVAIGVLLWKIPLVGWLLFIAVVIFEFIMLLGSKENMRLGDELAKTRVVEPEEVLQEKT